MSEHIVLVTWRYYCLLRSFWVPEHILGAFFLLSHSVEVGVRLDLDPPYDFMNCIGSEISLHV
jgi:uncharacterized membrane protein